MVNVFPQVAYASAASGWADLNPWGVVSVKDYGTVGDGVANDRTAILAARDAAGAGGTVYFPPGTYAITASLSLNLANQTWVLHQKATIFLTASSNSNMLSINATGVTVTGGTLDGNRANQTTANGSGIDIFQDDFTVQGVNVLRSKVYGIHSSGQNNIRILDCLVDDPGSVNIFMNPNTVTASGLLIRGNTCTRADATLDDYVIQVHGGSSSPYSDMQIIDNVVNNTATGRICIEVFYGHGCTVQGNNTRLGSMGLSVIQCNYATLTGNTIDGCDTYGIEAVGKGMAVTGNAIKGYAALPNGIALTGSSGQGDFMSVSGNTVYDVTGSGISLATTGHQHCAITGNTVYGSNHGIRLTQSHYASVTGNVLDGQSAGGYGVYCDTTYRVSIAGNQISNYTSGCVLFVATTAHTFDEITIAGNSAYNTTALYATSLSGGAALGEDICATKNTSFPDYLNVKRDVKALTGSGTPESVVAAGVGSTFYRYDGGTSTTLYVKTSGTGNTGWTAK